MTAPDPEILAIFADLPPEAGFSIDRVARAFKTIRDNDPETLREAVVDLYSVSGRLAAMVPLSSTGIERMRLLKASDTLLGTAVAAHSLAQQFHSLVEDYR